MGFSLKRLQVVLIGYVIIVQAYYLRMHTRFQV